MKQTFSFIASVLFVLALSVVSCKDEVKKLPHGMGFDIVGVWELKQEEWDYGEVRTEGFDRFKIFFDDMTFLSFRFAPVDDSDIFLAVDGGRYLFQDSVYKEMGDQKWEHRLVGDSVLRTKWPDKVQVWKRYSGLDVSTIQMIKEQTHDLQYHDEYGHPGLHLLSLTKMRADARRKYVIGGALAAVLIVFGAIGYAIWSRKRRRAVERRLAQFEAERQWATEESRNQREADEARFLQSDYYQRVRRKIESGEAMSQHDWDELEANVTMFAPDFLTKLQSLYRFSLVELHVCLLIKARFTPAEISTLLCKSQSGVSSIRSRLYKKVFNKKGSSIDWDDFIIHNL